MNAKLAGVAVALVLAGSAVVRAQGAVDDSPRGHNALRKLGRGVANVVFGFVELPNQMTKARAEHGGAGALTYGVGKGLLRWVGRELVGAYEIVSFAVPYPRGYKPVMKPEFPIEDYEP
jgi:putative exosortase-associated protein (TIGR04073 family)